MSRIATNSRSVRTRKGIRKFTCKLLSITYEIIKVDSTKSQIRSTIHDIFIEASQEFRCLKTDGDLALIFCDVNV